ncbi:MAG: DUF3899 domain-containing protein [Clostridia bacterium]|nr:DUF3899 domain-containing protein [Clostridia bacterium]
MKQENKSLLVKFLICFGVASALTLAVFWIKGFFTDSLANNIMVLADGFFVSGILITMFAGMIFISSQGALIGISFIVRNFVLAWIIPGGRKRQEMYADYRERKMSELKKPTDACVLITGLIFLAVGIIFNVIWYVKFYNVV